MRQESVPTGQGITETGQLALPSWLRRLHPFSLRLAPRWQDVLAAALISRAAIFFVTALAFGLVAPQQLPPSEGLPRTGVKLLDALWLWDGGWYGAVARIGYHLEPPFTPTAAFWPLYPLLVRLVSLPFGPQALYVAGLAIPVCGYVVGLSYVYRLAEQRWGRAVARSTVLLISIFPSSFFFNAGYPTGLLLAFTAGAFWYARQGAWWRAGLCGLFAALADVPGVLLSAPLGWEFLRQHGLSRRLLRPEILTLALPPLGLALFMAYLWLQVGHPLAFVRASELWHHHLAFWPHTLWDGLVQTYRQPFYSPLVTVNALVSAGFTLAALWWLARGEVAFGGWMLSVLGLYLSFPSVEPMDGIVRYMLPVFPGFIALALAVERWWWLRQLVVALFLMLLGLFTSLFVTNHWVA